MPLVWTHSLPSSPSGRQSLARDVSPGKRASTDRPSPVRGGRSSFASRGTANALGNAVPGLASWAMFCRPAGCIFPIRLNPSYPCWRGGLVSNRGCPVRLPNSHNLRTGLAPHSVISDDSLGSIWCGARWFGGTFPQTRINCRAQSLNLLTSYLRPVHFVKFISRQGMSPDFDAVDLQKDWHHASPIHRLPRPNLAAIGRVPANLRTEHGWSAPGHGCGLYHKISTGTGTDPPGQNAVGLSRVRPSHADFPRESRCSQTG